MATITANILLLCFLRLSITIPSSMAFSHLPTPRIPKPIPLKMTSSSTPPPPPPPPPLDRRTFLTTGPATALAVSSSTILSPSSATSQTTTPNNKPIELPPMGLGAWSWGDTLFWQYDSRNDDDLKEVFDYAVQRDLAFFDTAEVYGFGRSEMLLAQFRDSYPPEQASRVQIATKFAALPWRTSPSSVVNACRASISRLGGKQPIDLYQIHFPNAWANDQYWDGLAQCYEAGLVKAVGVSNYGVVALRAVHDALAKREIPLATNQIQLSMLYQWPLQNGLIEACRELDVEVLSYSPLALGFLTGKYSRENLPSGPRKVLGEELFKDDAFPGLLRVMKEIAEGHGGEGVPLSQVALNWARAKGTIPIPGARTLKQAKQNLGALDWNLEEGEVKMLDDAIAKVPALLSPDKEPFAKADIFTGMKMFDS